MLGAAGNRFSGCPCMYTCVRHHVLKVHSHSIIIIHLLHMQCLINCFC